MKYLFLLPLLDDLPGLFLSVGGSCFAEETGKHIKTMQVIHLFNLYITTT